MLDRLRRDRGLALAILALIAAIALYAPSVARGLVDYDDPVLYRDNWVVRDASWDHVQTILFDLDGPARQVLQPEYLPVRDLSVMLDYAIWGDHYGGFHLTNLVLYLLAIMVWFAALSELGVPREIAGLAVLLFAVHPSHAESVAWLAERKGLLGVMFAGLCACGFARFRAGGARRWLAIAMRAAVFAVWSKATAAFGVAALAGLELALPERRVSWRRSLVALGGIAAVGIVAFVPVLVVATSAQVVGSEVHAPAGRAELVLGVLGFYAQMGLGLGRNAVAYPIATGGPSVIELAVGAVSIIAIIAGLVRGAPIVRAAISIWLFAWLPASHLVLPLQMVVVADRYLLVPVLGLVLALAYGISRVRERRARIALGAVVVLALFARAFDAQSSWRSNLALWERAVEVDPRNGDAWSRYAQALIDAGDPNAARAAIAEGLEHGRSAPLLVRAALVANEEGDSATALALFREAASIGDRAAMANLASLLGEQNLVDEGLVWARRATADQFPYAFGFSVRGKLALRARDVGEALAMFERAYALAPTDANRYNLAAALLAMHRAPEALPHLVACARASDREVARACRFELAKFQRH